MNFDIVSRGSGKSQYAIRALREVWEQGKTSLMMCAGFMRFEDYQLICTYKCLKCKNQFEVELGFGVTPPKLPCPKCKSVRTRKIITIAPQVQFKGNGFYSTDNKK